MSKTLLRTAAGFSMLFSLLICSGNLFAQLIVPSNGKPFVPDELTIDESFKATEDKNNEFGIIGKDNRTHQYDTSKYPSTALGQLIMDNSTCSASLIGPSHVLTAAHCIFDNNEKTFSSSVYFAPGRSGSLFPHGLYRVTDIYMPRVYINSEVHGVGDVAVLKLARPAGDTLGWLGFKPFQKWDDVALEAANSYINEKVSGNTSIASEKVINEALNDLVYILPEFKVSYSGYSGDKPNQMWGQSCVYQSIGETEGNYEFVKSFCDSQPGSSGSGYFNDDFNILSVRSFQSVSATSIITDSNGNRTTFGKGDFNEVSNINLAINKYVSKLISNWKRDSYGDETLHYPLNMPSADFIENYKSFSVNNECNENIWVGVRFRDLSNNWVNKAFYELSGGENAQFRTSSNYFYYIALNDDRSWDGSDTVVTLYGDDYGMRKRSLEDYEHRNIDLTCK